MSVQGVQQFRIGRSPEAGIGKTPVSRFCHYAVTPSLIFLPSTIVAAISTVTFRFSYETVISTLEDVYNSRFIDTAVGSSLYNLGRAIGLRLLGAQKAVGYLTFTGEEGVEVPEGFLAETIAGSQ